MYGTMNMLLEIDRFNDFIVGIKEASRDIFIRFFFSAALGRRRVLHFCGADGRHTDRKGVTRDKRRGNKIHLLARNYAEKVWFNEPHVQEQMAR